MANASAKKCFKTMIKIIMSSSTIEELNALYLYIQAMEFYRSSREQEIRSILIPYDVKARKLK